MKFKIVSMLVTLAMITALPMIYMGQFNPLALIQGAGSETSEIARLQTMAPKNLSNAVTDEKLQLYKWRDKNGVMQFSNTPPPATANAEQVVLNPNHNVVQAVNVTAPAEQQQLQQVETQNPYTVKGMKQVMDDARGVEELLRKRHEHQQKMLNKL